MIKNSFFTFLILIIIVSCSSNSGGNIEQKGDHEDTTIIENKLKYELQNIIQIERFRVTVENRGKELDIFFFFALDQKKSIESYYLDEETYQLTISIALSKIQSYLKSYEKINIEVAREKEKIQNEVFKYSLSQDMINKISKSFVDNPDFIPSVKHTLKSLKPSQVVQLNAFIQVLNRDLKGFYFNGSYWTLLNIFNEECSDPNKDKEHVYLFLAFHNVLKSGREIYNIVIDEKITSYYLKNCNLDKSYLEIDLNELLVKLDKHYGKEGELIGSIIGSMTK